MQPFKKKFSIENIPDLRGKVAIVTGGATGIGKQTVIQLLRRNAKVYIASRSVSKFDQLLHDLESTDANVAERLKFLALDLSDMRSCIIAAKQFTELEQRLDVLIENAALSVMPNTLSKDGIEIQFAGNFTNLPVKIFNNLQYLGHFVFTHHLLSLIQATSETFGEARIVIVASHAHSMYQPAGPDKIDYENIKTEGAASIDNFAEVKASLQRYSRSKLANILFAQNLHKRLQESGCFGVYVNSLNPGTIGIAPGTESAAIPPIFGLISSSIVRLTSIPPEDGALTTLLLATDIEIQTKALSGRYFDVGPMAGKFYYGYSWDATDSKMSLLAKDAQLAENLWNWSINAMQSVKEASW
ncbi:hypothetical protein NQ176_g3726 [Zarea fungicola]|uniref:Uncharacterized protein n=1 Tax=Zarea fungicola TaxID=93591 RepID=A0ACC1NH34_9HYPO|nr:hypothetical protein NQ176_g3726 [Lecanicillium fungicola]